MTLNLISNDIHYQLDCNSIIAEKILNSNKGIHLLVKKVFVLTHSLPLEKGRIIYSVLKRRYPNVDTSLF